MRQVEVDELKVYRGDSYRITDKIFLRQPTLGDICGARDTLEGERGFFRTVYMLIATPTDLMVQLEDVGVYYEDVTNFELFCKLFPEMDKESVSLLIEDINPQKFHVEDVVNQDRKVLIDPDTMTVIDEYVYEGIVAYLCYMMNVKQTPFKKAGNKWSREVMMEAARNKLNSPNEPYKSMLKPLVSTMVNMEGFKFSWKDVWDMKLGAFMDSVQRVQTIISSRALLDGCYSGNIDVKKIRKTDLNYMKDLGHK